jgi:hypothetical protein
MRASVAGVAAAALVAGVVGMASPASAACTVGDQTCSNITFTISAGTLTLVAPSAASGTNTISGSGGVVDMSIGATVVNDTRLTSTGWSVSATASNFVSGGNTILKTASAFSVPNAITAPTGVTGLATCAASTRKTTPTTVDAGGTTAAIVSCTSAGTSGATYTPELLVTLPSTVVAGTYTGTVTQSVA